ncbi:Effector protein hopW1-1, partial [Pseudomonas savastanoi pv. glycinea]
LSTPSRNFSGRSTTHIFMESYTAERRNRPMNPDRITCFPHSFPPSFSRTSSSAENSHAQSSQQVLTRAFVASGELNAAFGRTSTAFAQHFTRLLATLQHELERKTQPFTDLAQLAIFRILRPPPP